MVYIVDNVAINSVRYIIATEAKLKPRQTSKIGF